MNSKKDNNVLAVFAHPDDETWVSGTLSKLAYCGLTVTPVYVTSGDAGSDYSGAKLTGQALAKSRETEALKATNALGLSVPVFLRYPDGKVDRYYSEIRDKLTSIMDELEPIAVITFGKDGITGHMDHISVGDIATEVSQGKTVYFAVSQSRAELFAQYARKHGIDFIVPEPVADADVTHRVDVSLKGKNRISAQASYKTQFPTVMIQAFADFVNNVPTEELVIPKSSNELDEFLNQLEMP
ncbi:MAG: PIG-L family deacetylase [Xenococcus sp. MO_188.B8]|nr:PIG-L family deacetylase [Xenococcus sp. MO_188.B8]